jgi:hypothetical protein
MMSITTGPKLIDLIALAYKANQPVLLHGSHGVGKSDLLGAAAQALGIACIVADLSLMEPPDLVGIPRVHEDGRTHYAPPAFLPCAGRGLLVFEELNRCPRYLAAPCLQLLTARRLNDYALPAGWLPCAAVNDASDGYQTDELDPALLSRFLQVRVIPEVSAWLGWARAQKVHPKICAFVEQSPDVFVDPAANPRAWTYANNLLTAWEQTAREESILATLLAGVLGERWALAFLQFFGNERRPIQPDEIIEAYPAHAATVRQWIAGGHLDAVAASIELLKRFLQPQRRYDAVVADPAQKANVDLFLADLPGDLKRGVQEWFAERGFDGFTSTVPRSRKGRRP